MRFTKLLIITIGILLSASLSPGEIMAQPAPEQYTKTAAETSEDDATIAVNFNALSSNVTSLTATVTRLTDAAAGTVYLQGRNLASGTWHTIDSFVLTDVALQEKVFAVTSMAYYDYRLNYVGSGTGTRTLKFTYVRRPDDR